MKKYISNRLLRLYPIYFFILLCTLIANIYAFKHGGSPKISLFLSLVKQHRFPVSGFLLYIFSSLTLLFQDLIPSIGLNKGALYFITSSHIINTERLGYFNLVPQSWSLGSEVLFYLLAPFIVKRTNTFLFLLAVAGIAFRIYLSVTYGLDPWSQAFFPSILPFFILGIFSYRLYRSEFFKQNAERLQTKLAWSLPVFVLILFTNNFVGESSLINFLYPVALLFFIPCVFHSYKRKTWDKHIGELSYPVYISHLFVAMILKVLLPNPFFHNGFFLSAITIIFSLLLIKLIADPIEKIRQKRLISG